MAGRMVVLGLAAALGLGVLGSAPARADCVEVDLEIRYADRPSWYPLGQPDYCVVPTDWNHAHELWVERDFDDPQPGMPSGVWFHIWIPLP